jgi:hypothetical protein
MHVTRCKKQAVVQTRKVASRGEEEQEQEEKEEQVQEQELRLRCRWDCA